MENVVAMVDRHFEILNQVFKEQPIGIVRLADATGYPRHRVRYSLRRLEEERVIEPTSQGAVTTEEALDFIDNYNDRLAAVITELESLPPIDEIDTG